MAQKAEESSLNDADVMMNVPGFRVTSHSQLNRQKPGQKWVRQHFNKKTQDDEVKVFWGRYVLSCGQETLSCRMIITLGHGA